MTILGFLVSMIVVGVLRKYGHREVTIPRLTEGYEVVCSFDTSLMGQAALRPRCTDELRDVEIIETCTRGTAIFTEARALIASVDKTHRFSYTAQRAIENCYMEIGPNGVRSFAEASPEEIVSLASKITEIMRLDIARDAEAIEKLIGGGSK